MLEELTCITCPMGCHLEAEWEETAGEKTVLSVRGNTCPRGDQYARAELTHPERMVTSTVAISGARYSKLPVVTSDPIPKERIFDVMKEIQKTTVAAPVHIHDCIISNICGLGVDMVASRSLEKVTTP